MAAPELPFDIKFGLSLEKLKEGNSELLLEIVAGSTATLYCHEIYYGA